MSTVKAINHQVGNDATATNNFTWYQPSVPDGTVRLGVGISGATSTDVMVATNGSKLGLGTSTPTYKIDTYFTNNDDGIRIKANAGGGPALFIECADTGGHQYRLISTGTLNGPGAGCLGFYDGTATAYRMVLDSNGFVGIGDTSPSSTSPLTVKTAPTNANVGQICARSPSAGDVANAGMSVIKVDNNTTTSQIFFKFLINNASAGSGQINANGASAAAFGSYSDARLKENIEPLPSQLNNIMALKPCEFDYKDGSGHQIGFIAQEMQEVYPDVVGEDSSEEKILMVTGWSKTEARLVKAIQELKAELDELKAKVNA